MDLYQTLIDSALGSGGGGGGGIWNDAYAVGYFNGTGETIEVPEGVTIIPYYSFAQRSGLKHIVIPSTVTKINANIANGSSALVDVSFMGTTPPSDINSMIWSGANYTFVIYVPDSAVQAYKTAFPNQSDRVKPMSQRPW